MNSRKYIVVTGGVISGLGKGITAASIGFFFSEKYKVCPIKLDGYLNTDPGTMNPVEHGEVFVLDDGAEVDMDFGHYERFLGVSALKSQSITMGKIFQNVRVRERRGDFLGQTVQLIPHVTDLIQDKILKICDDQKADLALIEVGGTVGDIENELFLEACRQLEKKVGNENICFVHLTYVPIPYGVNEQKTKPTQQSVNTLQKKGIWPDIIIGRCTEELQEKVKKKIALFANVQETDVFSAPDLSCVYSLPSFFEKENLVGRISQKLNISKPETSKLDTWNSLLMKKKKEKVTIAIAGKYTDLEDSYASVVEAINHAAFHLECEVEIEWVETTNVDFNQLKKIDGIIVPGGFGSRGVEGKINIINYARKKNIPFLGICYGLQLSVIEFLRNECQIEDAQSMEIDENTKCPVITLLDEQKNVVKMGGTMRLGSYEAKLKNSKTRKLYEKFGLIKNTIISERHRHRFEVNPAFVSKFEEKGLNVVGKSYERDLVEFIELENHQYFVATQAHPELKSKLEKPAPLFYGLIEAALKRK